MSSIRQKNRSAIWKNNGREGWQRFFPVPMMLCHDTLEHQPTSAVKGILRSVGVPVVLDRFPDSHYGAPDGRSVTYQSPIPWS